MFGQRIRLFRISGFQVAIDTSWIFIAFLITWSLAMGLFPATLPGLSPGVYWLMGLLGMLGLFASVLLHELSHALVGRRHGLPMGGITLFLFGGMAEMEDEPQTPRVEFRVAVVGPFVSLAIGAFCYLFLVLGESAGWSRAMGGVLGYLAWMNLVLAVFNLIPAFPLDGGRLLRAFLWSRNRTLPEATRLAAAGGSLFGWVLIVLGFFNFFRGNFLGGMWWVLIGMFLKGAAKVSYQQVLMRKVLAGETVERFMTKDPVAVPPDITVQQLIDEFLYRHQYKLYPVTEGGRVVGCIRMIDIKKIDREEWPRRKVRDVVRACSPESTVTPHTSARDALRLMERTGESRLLVVEGNQLVGVVSLKDLMGFLALRLELERDEEEERRAA